MKKEELLHINLEHILYIKGIGADLNISSQNQNSQNIF